MLKMEILPSAPVQIVEPSFKNLNTNNSWMTMIGKSWRRSTNFTLLDQTQPSFSARVDVCQKY